MMSIKCSVSFRGGLFFWWLFVLAMLGSRLNAQDSISAYSQPYLKKYLQIVSPAQSASYSFWVDQTASCSITVSSIEKNLGIQMTGPTGNVFVFGQPASPSFQSALSPDPVIYPDAPGANYHIDLGTPTIGQWTMQVTAPTAPATILTFPIRIAFNNQVGALLFGGGGSSPLGSNVSFGMAVLDGTNKIGNIQISAVMFRLDDPTISPIQITFTDDGQGADYLADDSIYSVYVTPAQAGSYMLQIEVSGDASTGHFQRSISSGFKIAPATASITGAFTARPRVGVPK